METTIRTMPSRENKNPLKNTEIEISSKRNLAHHWAHHMAANGRQEVKLGSQKPPKDGNESQTHGLSNALLHSYVGKSWNHRHLASKSDPKSIFSTFRFFVKFDHELAQTPELDVWLPSPVKYHLCSARKTTIRTVKSMNSMNKKWTSKVCQIKKRVNYVSSL